MRDVLAIVDALCARGPAVLLVEQAAQTAPDIAHHVVVLDTGRVVLDRPPCDVDAAVMERAYLGQ